MVCSAKIFNCIEQEKLFWDQDLENKNIFFLKAPLLQTLFLRVFFNRGPNPGTRLNLPGHLHCFCCQLLLLFSVWSLGDCSGIPLVCSVLGLGEGGEGWKCSVRWEKPGTCSPAFQLFPVAQLEVRSFLLLASSTLCLYQNCVGSTIFNCTVCAFWRFIPCEKLWLGRAF